MQNLKELKVSESFALEINLQSSFFIPFYAALVKEASNDLPELDFFFLCYDYKLIPASHRITTERLMYEYFIADGCPHRIWISDAIKAEIESGKGYGRSDIFDNALSYCDELLLGIWKKSATLIRKGKTLKAINLKDVVPKYMVNPVLNFFQKHSKVHKIFSFYMYPNCLREWIFNMRPKDCISFWISMLNRDPDTLLCRELLSGIISDRVEYMSLFIHELLKVEQSKMESVQKWRLHEGYVKEIFLHFIFKYSYGLNQALCKLISSFYDSIIKSNGSLDSSKIIEFLSLAIEELFKPNTINPLINLLLFKLNNHLMQVYGDSRTEEWILKHGVVNLLLSYLLRCLEWPQWIDIKVTNASAALPIIKKIAIIFIMYSCDQQKIFIDLKDKPLISLNSEFVNLSVWKKLTSLCSPFMNKSSSEINTQYNEAIFSYYKKLGVHLNDEGDLQDLIFANSEDELLFYGQHLITQSEFISNRYINDDLISFFQENYSPSELRVGYRRPNFKFSESKGKTLLLDVEVISNKFTLLIEDLKEREKKKSKNDDKTSKDAISETLTKTGLNKLVMEEKLGKGQYGEVYKASHKNLAIPIAVKMIRNYDELAIKELQILNALNHPNIVSVYHSALQTVNFIDSLWIIMELCESDMQKYLDEPGAIHSSIDDTVKMEWIIQLLHAMDYLESNNVIHRDIKPGNILLKRVNTKKGEKFVDNWIPKIADFGMARKFEHDNSKTMAAYVGTEIYNAPELWRMKAGRAEQPYEYLVDIWSLGLVILQVIMEMKSKDLIQLITSTCIDESCYDLLNPDLVPVLQNCIKTDYVKALTFFPPLVHMITLTQYRKSAIELLEIRQEPYNSDSYNRRVGASKIKSLTEPLASDNNTSDNGSDKNLSNSEKLSASGKSENRDKTTNHNTNAIFSRFQNSLLEKGHTSESDSSHATSTSDVLNDAPPKKGKRSHRSSPLEVKDIKPKSPSERKTKPSSECTKDTKNAIDVKANSTSDRSSSEVNQVKEIKDKNSNSPVSVGESPSTPKTYSSSQSPIADKKETIVEWCERHNISTLLPALQAMDLLAPDEFLELTEEDVAAIVLECKMTFGVKARFLKAIKELKS